MTEQAKPVTCPRCGGKGVLDGTSAHNMYVGARIAELRGKHSLTQEELAGKVGKSRAQIANIEAGRIDLPLSLLLKFAEALDVTPKEIIP